MACVQEQPADMDVDGDESNINDGRVTEETNYPSPEELVAKSRAPVKKEYICAAPPAPRGVEESKISVVKKSKRQRRKDRLEEVSKGICNAVVKAGDVNACPFKDCRFSHDLEAFISQKEPDLPGDCPFLLKPEPCPYGQACRFARSHASKVLKKTNTDKEDSSFEMNVLSKDTQKLLRKNMVEFPKSDEQLKDLGLWIKVKQSPKLVNEEQLSSSSNGDTDNVTVKLEKDLDTNGITVAEPIIKKPRIHSDSVANSVLGAVDSTQEKNGRENSMDNSTDYKETKLHLREKKLIDFREKLYLAPLTTVGNLPFRRLCKVLGADITCGEMAMCSNLLQGQSSEWALLRRHSSEDLFGVQICGAHPDTVAHTVEIIEQECKVDFIDINVGCPIDIVVNKGAGSCLLTKPTRMYNMIKAASRTMEKPLTVKVRMGYFEGKNCIHSMIPEIGKSGAAAITIHGRTRQQRYNKLADWSYIEKCVKEAPDALQVVGNGDIFAYTDWNDHLRNGSNLSTCMIARGALIKPWLFTEIKEQRHWDITSGERLELLRDYVRFGLQHWGSDKKGVETTRYFLLEWLSYMYRYVPVGLLDILPQRMNWRPPSYFGRNDLETLMASDSAADWVRISEMLLGPVPEGFSFTPKHKSNAYDRAENG